MEQDDEVLVSTLTLSPRLSLLPSGTAMSEADLQRVTIFTSHLLLIASRRSPVAKVGGLTLTDASVMIG